VFPLPELDSAITVIPLFKRENSENFLFSNVCLIFWLIGLSNPRKSLKLSLNRLFILLFSLSIINFLNSEKETYPIYASSILGITDKEILFSNLNSVFKGDIAFLCFEINIALSINCI
jgi:hypothetical protein